MNEHNGWWSRLFPRILKVCRSKSYQDLYKAYNESDSISFKTVVLSRLLNRRMKVFEEKLAQSENYPHEVDWDAIGEEMFTLLEMCKSQLGIIITKSKVMEEMLSSNPYKDLRFLKSIEEECYMIVQEDVPYTKEEVKAMAKTIHDLREKLSLLGWHPASEFPVVPEHYNWISVVAIVLDMDDNSTRATNATFNKDKGWIFPEFSRVLYWCYRPKED